MNIILFSDKEQKSLYPLTFTRPAGELRMGILTFRERWVKLLNTNKVSYLTDEYLSRCYPTQVEEENLFLHSAFLPTHNLVESVLSLAPNQGLTYQGQILAYRGALNNFENPETLTEYSEELVHIARPYDLFSYNDIALKFDFELITNGRESQPISATNGVIKPENIFLEEGASVEFAILNATDSYIYVGKNATISEGSLIKGSLAMCEHAQLNMGAKIYGATTLGPYCKVGGEVNNAILTGYSNKGHEGFLGNSVIGEWCNLGADTNNSNLKNNYSEVKLWDYTQNRFRKTGLQFCGLIMGDHSKSAINSQFNTGTVVGVFSNIFKSGFPPNKIDSFSWGGHSHDPKFRLEKAYEVAERMMQRRKVELTDELKELYSFLFDHEESLYFA